MRLTRAALRAQAENEPHFIHEDEHASLERVVEDNNSGRPPLKDITDANLQEEILLHTNRSDKTHQEGTDRAAGIKRTKKTEVTTPEAQGSDIAANNLKDMSKDSTEAPRMATVAALEPEIFLEVSELPKTEPIERQPHSVPPPSSYEITITTKKPNKKALKFDSNSGKLEEKKPDTEQDSFVDNIKTRFPTKTFQPEEDYDDSFVKHIVARSPSKPVTRIEDSVEQLDALEDAIDQITEELPSLVVPSHPTQAQNTMSTTKTSTSMSGPQRTPSGRIMSSKPAQARPLVTKAQMREVVVKPIAVKESNNTLPSVSATTTSSRLSSTPNTKLATSKPGFIPSKSNKPTTKSTFSLPGEAVAAKLKAQREERLAKMGRTIQTDGIKKSQSVSGTRRIPSNPDNSASKNARRSTSILNTKTLQPTTRRMTSSSKPVTTSSFTLPGDAVAAKLKAQREQRLKRDVESVAKPFKPRPVPVKSRPSIVPRTNKASQARLSMGNKENIAPKKLMAKPTPVQANSSACRVNSNAVATVHNEKKIEKDQPQMTRQEREEAAKKARAEAAERGRAASRDWAEKQRKKAAATTQIQKSDEETEVAMMDKVVA